MGRAASANNYLGSAVLAVGVLNALQPSDIRDRLLSDVASGALRVAVALGPLISCPTPWAPTGFWWSPPMPTAYPSSSTLPV